MQIIIALIVIALGFFLFRLIFRLLNKMQDKLESWSTEEAPPLRRPSKRSSAPVYADGIVYLFAHEFVQPPAPRPLGSVPRDRAYACQTGQELDPDDFARQLLYALFVELIEEGYIEWRFAKRDPTFMPPYPHKQWELQLRQARPFPSSPLMESLEVGFELCLRARQRRKKDSFELNGEEEFFTMEEIIEQALKAIRHERTFWERGTCCSDLRGHVETAMIESDYLRLPRRETWLQTLRPGRPVCNMEAIKTLAPQAQALKRRLYSFRQRYGSAIAKNPQKNERGQLMDIDPQLATYSGDFQNMPLDDCLRITIHEVIASIKQLEPSGEAGI